MHLADEFQSLLIELSDLDHDIINALSVDEINTEEIAALVDKREQLLLSVQSLLDETPQFTQTEQWRSAIHLTQRVVTMLEEKTKAIGLSLQKLRHGNRSVQQYKKFL